jgi:uncharacterized protein
MRALRLLLVALVVLFAGASPARASFVVPPIEGHVTDAAGVLTAAERADLEGRLDAHMQRSGAEIAVLVARSLEGESIDDLAYRTFNTWRVGRQGLDNGVLLVVAPKERRMRIETGKGVGGQLTDLQASDILEHTMAPLLRAGRYHDAIALGVDAIAALIATPSPTDHALPPESAVAGIVVLALFLALFVLRALLAGPWLGWVGRLGGPGRGFMGGGYKGGGGRSGGGGASGRW